MKKILSISILLFITGNVLFSQSLKSPLMGWASWNQFNVNISESIIKEQADAMITKGFQAAGYQYVNIDDGFFDGRYADGALKIDITKFPNGMKYLADYIHSKGLKAGFYSDAGSNTCGSVSEGQTGGIGVGLYMHDQQDIDTIFRSWGYDFLKVDYCGGVRQRLDEQTRYTAVRKAMNNTGRTDINFNVCRWQFPGTWVTKVADSWRISSDIALNWSSITSIIDQNAFLTAYCSQGHYNDMDMLQVGRGLTYEEDKSHFSMWCIMSSPLVLGNDLRNITDQTKDILINSEVIAVNQDTTGLQAKIVSDNGLGQQVWAKNLNGKLSNERAVALLNRSSINAAMSVKWSDLNLVGSANVRDLWQHVDLGSYEDNYTVSVPAHGVVMLKVVGNQSKLQEIFEAEYGWINNYNYTANSIVLQEQGSPVVDPTCSGRAKVRFLGNREDNYLEFRDVFANVAGKYNLKITFSSGENRNIILSINGKDTTITALNSGGWSTLKSINFTVNLQNGNNTIKMYNPVGWMPDIDKIELDLNRYINPASVEEPNFGRINNSLLVRTSGSNLTIESKELCYASIFDLTGRAITVNPIKVLGNVNINAGNNQVVLVRVNMNTGESKTFKVYMN